ncbi:MAG: agmatinase [Rhodospirillaceae bacterium]|jgi:guanidinopropionase|nr:agmatinase [Rhodospirillaceae bacterium]MBT6118875.1 agmatinase [Rhodospirillaceae bacterium]
MKDWYERTHPVTGERYVARDEPGYADIPTFMRCPRPDDLTEIDIAFVGVPYDGQATERVGARQGPREIRNASTVLRAINHATGVDPFALSRIADAGDVRLPRAFDVMATIEDIAGFYRPITAAGVVPLSAGGDHSISYPILKALAEDGPVGLVDIDAHLDLWDSYLGSRYHHGSQFRRAVEDGLIDPNRMVQIGLRGAQNTREGWDFQREHGIRGIYIEEFRETGVAGAIQEARRIAGEGPTYLTFDIDALDPVFAPGTGTPEIGGITTFEAQQLLRGLRGLDFIGADLVEVSPPLDPSGNTALTGATLMYEMLCLLAEARAARG